MHDLLSRSVIYLITPFFPTPPAHLRILYLLPHLRLPRPLHRFLNLSVPATQRASLVTHTFSGGFCRHLCECLLYRPHTKYQSSSKYANKRGFSCFSAAIAVLMTPGRSNNHLSRCIFICLAYTARKAIWVVRSWRSTWEEGWWRTAVGENEVTRPPRQDFGDDTGFEDKELPRGRWYLCDNWGIGKRAF